MLKPAPADYLVAGGVLGQAGGSMGLHPLLCLIASRLPPTFGFTTKSTRPHCLCVRRVRSPISLSLFCQPHLSTHTKAPPPASSFSTTSHHNVTSESPHEQQKFLHSCNYEIALPRSITPVSRSLLSLLPLLLRIPTTNLHHSLPTRNHSSRLLHLYTLCDR